MAEHFSVKPLGRVRNGSAFLFSILREVFWQKVHSFCYVFTVSNHYKKLRFDIHIFNLDCPKEGREFDYSRGMMHGWTQ
jgi:hypothetical protein